MDRVTPLTTPRSPTLGPVFLAAATSVLGVIPVLPHVFWVDLAVTIMAGLTIGTAFTMIAVPVLCT